MGADLIQLGILTRREIEARIVGPLITGFIKEFGRARTLRILEDVIQSLARESGAQLAELLEGNSMAHFARGMAFWKQDDALKIEVLGQDDTQFSFNVRRCRYAEMYKALGMEEFGHILSCARDFAMIEGFNPKIKLTRTRTIMEGASHCDFRYEMIEEETE